MKKLVYLFNHGHKTINNFLWEIQLGTTLCPAPTSPSFTCPTFLRLNWQQFYLRAFTDKWKTKWTFMRTLKRAGSLHYCFLFSPHPARSVWPGPLKAVIIFYLMLICHFSSLRRDKCSHIKGLPQQFTLFSRFIRTLPSGYGGGACTASTRQK